jgi:hypothetical protein
MLVCPKTVNIHESSISISLRKHGASRVVVVVGGGGDDDDDDDDNGGDDDIITFAEDL